MSLRDQLGRVFGSGENPLRWAIPLYSAWGIAVRIHVFFVLFVVVRLLFTLPHGAAGVGYVALIFGSLFGLVLLHEYGHCAGARSTGGEADEILLWPLGGLAFCSPPHHWRAHFITAAAGPAVNAALLPVLTITCWLAAGQQAAIFNPLNPTAAFASISTPSTALTWMLIALVALHYANTILLAFNVLVPMYPMDGGRILHALLWRNMGYSGAMETTALVGMITAGVLGVVAIALNQVLLLVIALFGGVVCWQERRQARFASSPEDDIFAESLRESEQFERTAERERLEAQKRREEERRRQAEVDRILEKIAKQGMASLTRKEKRTLEQASEAKRTGAS